MNTADKDSDASDPEGHRACTPYAPSGRITMDSPGPAASAAGGPLISLAATVTATRAAINGPRPLTTQRPARTYYGKVERGTTLRRLALDGRADGDVADFDVIGLFEGEDNGTGGSVRRGTANASLFRRTCSRTSGSSTESASSVRMYPGDTAVVRSTPSVDSWRSPSSRARTAFLVAA